MTNAALDLARLRHVLCLATERCNLRCATCYAAAGEAAAGPLTVDDACRALELLLGATREPELCWSFTGGEPLLVGREWLATVLEHGAALAARHAVALRWEVQSNLLLLDDPLERLLVAHGVALGTSIDGPPDLQARQRPGAEGTAAVWRRLAAAGRPPGVLCVVGAEAWRRRRELVDYFAALAVPVLKLAPLRALGRGAALAPLTPSMLLELRLTFVERLLAGGYRFFDPDLFLYVTTFRDGRPSAATDRSCTAVRCGAGVTSVSVDVDGTIHACIQPARVRGFALGDVRRGLSSASGAAALRAFHGSDAWTVRCFDCRARGICFFGCAAVAHAAPEQRDVECGFTRLFWDWLAADGARTARLHALLEEQRAAFAVGVAPPASIYLPRAR